MVWTFGISPSRVNIFMEAKVTPHASHLPGQHPLGDDLRSFTSKLMPTFQVVPEPTVTVSDIPQFAQESPC
jgi:hypothetical protein